MVIELYRKLDKLVSRNSISNSFLSCVNCASATASTARLFLVLVRQCSPAAARSLDLVALIAYSDP